MKPQAQHERCTKNDCRRLFAGSAEELLWLCRTLTGNDELSERILDAALEQSLKGADSVFRDWMHSWARRLVIKVCVETMRPQTSDFSRGGYLVLTERMDPVDAGHLAAVLSLPSDVLQQRLLSLDVLSRFVFVLRAVEGYSRHETALLLNIDAMACEWHYVAAAQSLEDQDSASWAAGWNPGTSDNLALARN